MNTPRRKAAIHKEAMKLSLAVSVFMLCAKCLAYFFTESTAVLADAAESVAHILVTAFSTYSVYLASKPPDTNHPYGHDRVVIFSIALEAGLILGTGVFVTLEAVRSLFRNAEVHHIHYGILIIAALSVVNWFLGVFLLKRGHRFHSQVLISNGHHVLSDMWTSVAVVVGLFLVSITGIRWIDPLVALMACGQIFWSGFFVLRKAVFHGMDEASQQDTDRLLAVLDAAKGSGLLMNYHQLRHREVNGNRWVEVHFLFGDDTSLVEAHRRATQVEAMLDKAFPEGKVFVTSHLEPKAHSDEHPRGHEPLDALTGHRKL